MTTNFEKLKREVLSNSNTNIWEEAVKEWKCIDVARFPGSICTCGHCPITNVCLMENGITKRRLEVGNCCVQKFTGRDYSEKFEQLKRKEKEVVNRSKHKNQIEEFESLINSGKLSEWDINFMKDMINILLLNDGKLTEGRW